ncbi:hypothetical protein IJ843_02995 [bacterium]|nr:hypothetical protein [bacterium]
MNKIIEKKTVQTVYDIYSELQILYFALQTLDEDIELFSILNSVERIYKKVEELNKIFMEKML